MTQRHPTAECPFQGDVLLLGDGELPFERAVLAEAHLAVCGDCRALEATIYAVETVLETSMPAPTGACERALAALPAPRVATPAAAWWVAACGLAALAWFVPPPGTVPATPPTEHAEAPRSTPEPDGGERVAETDPFAIPPPSARRPVDVRELLAAGESVARVAGRVERGGLPASRALSRALEASSGGERADLLAVARRIPEGAVLTTLTRLAATDPMAWSVLADLSLPGTEDVLAGGLADERARLALRALERIGGPVAVRHVERHTRSVTPEHFAESVAVLRRMDAAAALTVLIEQDQDPEWRPVVLGVVSADPQLWLPALRAEVRRGDVLPARACCDVLAAHGDRAVVDDLVRAAARRGLRDAAVGALVELGGEEAWRSAARMAARRPELESHFDGRVAAAESLADGIETWPAVPVDTLIRLLGRVGGEAALAALERLLDSGSQSADLPRALARIDSRAATARLIALLDDARFGRSALESVRRLPAERVVPLLLDRYERSGRRSRVHAALVEIAGVDLGADAALWSDWWDSQT